MSILHPNVDALFQNSKQCEQALQGYLRRARVNTDDKVTEKVTSRFDFASDWLSGRRVIELITAVIRFSLVLP